MQAYLGEAQILNSHIAPKGTTLGSVRQRQHGQQGRDVHACAQTICTATTQALASQQGCEPYERVGQQRCPIRHRRDIQNLTTAAGASRQAQSAGQQRAQQRVNAGRRQGLGPKAHMRSLHARTSASASNAPSSVSMPGADRGFWPQSAHALASCQDQRVGQ